MSLPEKFQKKLPLLLSVLLVSTGFLIYWRVFNYSFIQDDLGVLYSFSLHPVFANLKEIILPAGKLFYRPVGDLYLLMLYKIAGLNPAGFHIPALFIHGGTSLLIVRILQKLSFDTLLSWSTGFLYSIALPIHLDTVVWMVGIYDILGSFLFFLSLYLWLDRRTTSSILMFIFALLTKEACIVLPGVLLTVCMLKEQKGSSFGERLRESLREISPHGIVLCCYVLLRVLMLQNPLSDGAGPYRIELGAHIFSNIYLYVQWLFQSFSLLTAVDQIKDAVIVGLLLSIGILIIWQRRNLAGAVPLILWMIIGFAPVTFVVHHAFRYYLVYSLPAFILIVLQCGLLLLNRLNVPKRVSTIVITLLIIASAGYSWEIFYQLDRQALILRPVEGWNNLTRKGVLAAMAKEFLLENFGTAPRGLNLIFDKRLVGPICGGSGPRLWLQDPDLRVYDLTQVKIDSAGVYPVVGQGNGDQNNPSSVDSTMYLDLRKTYFIIVRESSPGRFYLASYQKQPR